MEQLLGDYKLLKKLGEGTLGTTFLAEHRFIKQPFVLKVLPQELARDSSFIEAFETEISRVATLDHPHIVKVQNVSHSDGVYFLASEAVFDPTGEMKNLKHYLEGKKLREDEVVTILTQVASALDYAHKHRGEKIIHGSLKLTNILISSGEKKPSIKLVDFGLAKIIGASKIAGRCFKAECDLLSSIEHHEKYVTAYFDSTKLSKLSAAFADSFAFLAPEQKRRGALGLSSDSYSFGVLAFYLLTQTFPEGAFELPRSEINFELLIKKTLHPHPEKRALELAALIQEMLEPPSLPFRKLEEVKKEESELHLFHEVPKEEKVLVGVSLHKSEESGERLAVTEYLPEKREAKHFEPLLSEAIKISGGTFQMGSNEGNRDELPVHRVDLPSFIIDIHPVTNEQFIRFLEFMGGEKDHNYNDMIRLKDSRINRQGGKLSIESGYSKHPVVGVSWHGAVAYAKWIGKRLPTEAEWEIAACGGLNSPLFPTGNTIEKAQSNFFSSDTTPVMSYKPNGYGLYDMAGNVYEWCQDWYGYNYYEVAAVEPSNPKGPPQGVYRVLRGGCWKSLKEDLRCTHRHRNNPGSLNGTYGFRLASDA